MQQSRGGGLNDACHAQGDEHTVEAHDKAVVPLDAPHQLLASETPARIMGVDDRKGALQKDMDADVLILDRELNIRAAWAMGRLVEDTNTLF